MSRKKIKFSPFSLFPMVFAGCLLLGIFDASCLYAGISSTTQVSMDIWDSPPPPLVSAKESLDKETDPTNRKISPVIGLLQNNLLPTVTVPELVRARKFLNILQYDLTYSVHGPLQLHSSVLAFLFNTSDDASASTSAAWNNLLFLSDISFGVRYTFGRFFFLGGGLGFGLFGDIHNQTLIKLVLHRVFIYGEWGVFRRFSPFSFLVASIQFNLTGDPIASTPLFFSQKSGILNILLFLGWRWDY